MNNNCEEIEMNTQIIIPNMDAIALPAPYWLFKLLLVLTFILHIVIMNFMFGGSIIALMSRFRSGKDSKYGQLASDIFKKIPSLLAATITLGVAPLLFLQVIYGQYFYTSSIIIAWPWFLVLVLLTLAYYGFYIVAFKAERAKRAIGWIMLLSVFFIFLIGFFYSNNLTLMLAPEKWAAKYFGNPMGWNLNWGEGMLIPRFLHFFVASIAIGALLLVLTGFFRWRKDKEYARFMIVLGGKWFMYTTMAQFIMGIWFLISLPREKMLLFMGDNMLATIALLIGISGALAAIFIMSNALKTDDPRKGAGMAIALIALVVVFMSIMRDILRDAYLSPYFDPSRFVVKTQWDVLILFLLLFVAGVVLWIVMFKKYFFSPELQVKQ